MQTKIHINLTQGIIDVEGDVEFVKAVYEDFKDRIIENAAPTPPSTEHPATPATDTGSGAPTKAKRRASPRRKASAAEGGDVGVNPDAPKLDKKVDTSQLRVFYEQFEPGSAPEKILIFLKYLIERAGIEKPNTDQVYTCFYSLKEKAPKAYAQAFRDAASKRGFIDFNSPTEIQITIMGENHFNHDLKKKGAE